MIEMSLNKVSKNFGSDRVLDEISFDIKTGSKVSLIGPNGSGKTTILKMILGEENVTSGSISIRRGSSIGILSQIPKIHEDNVTVRDVLNEGIKNVLELKDKLDSYKEKLSSATEDDLDKIISRYTKIQEEFIRLGGYELESKIQKLIKVFKISQELLDRDFNSLSGGEKTNVSFASLILGKPDILLLDEPTNHLDIDTCEWLEDYLIGFKGTILVVSHDRYFLDRVTSTTILLERGNVEIFNGNYSYYLKENEERILLEFKDYKNQQKEIDAMKKASAQLREWGILGNNEIFFKRAKAIERRLESLEVLNKPQEKKSLPLSFDSFKRSGKVVVTVKDLTLSFSKILFHKISFEIYYKERICIMGKNGTGKSSLIKEIIKNNNLAIKVGSNVSVGYIPQEIYFEDENLTILEEARKYFVGNESILRAKLDKFLFFGDNILNKIKFLSGGERVRLKLFCLMQNEYNLLVLDEVTNHIDIDTKEILEESLKNFSGTIIFISHDRYFINNLATRILNIENTKVISYVGNYDDFKNCVKHFY